jgi:hypothetical protein
MKQAMFTLKLPPGMRDAIVLLAVQRRVSMSRVVREALCAQYGIAEPRTWVCRRGPGGKGSVNRLDRSEYAQPYGDDPARREGRAARAAG